MSVPSAAAAFVAPVLGDIEHARELAGATSASVWAVWGARGDAVLRLFTNEQWLALEPDLAQHEAAVLDLVAAHGMDTPELLAVDTDGSVAGVPAILMTRLPGTPVLEPPDRDTWLDAMVEPLLRLAEIEAPAFAWSYRPWFEDTAPLPPAASSRPDVWLEAHSRATTWSFPTAPTLVHRDYHPGNILWEGTRLTGIVDWVNGCRGPTDIDVAGCAVDIALLEGSDAAFAFVRRWERTSGASLDPRWLLVSAVEMGELDGVKTAWDALGTVRPLQWYWQQIDEFLARSLALT